MSLKSIFNLVLTNDGKRYNTGDISEKTGLQKQPDGSWKPPKGTKTTNNKQQVVANKEKIIKSFKTDAENMATEQLKYKLEDLNNGKDSGYGMLEEQKKIYKAELEKRNGKSTSIPFNPKTLEYKEKNSKGEWETKKFEPEELLEEMQEMRKEYKTANKKDSLERIDREIAGLQEYIKNQNKTPKAELENGNRTSSAREELIKLEKERRSYGDDSKNDYAGHKIRLKQADLLNKAGFKDRKEFDEFYENPYALSKEEKNEAMKNPKTRLSQKYDEVIKSKKGTPQYNTALEEYTKEREIYKNSEGVEAVKEFPVVPTSKDSACRLTADTKIRLKK